MRLPALKYGTQLDGAIASLRSGVGDRLRAGVKAGDVPAISTFSRFGVYGALNRAWPCKPETGRPKTGY